MNLALGSLFDNKILDSFEFEVTNFIPIEYFSKDIEVDSYMKPVIVFQGDLFETDFELDRLRKFMLDFFRIKDLEEVDISDLRRVVVISVAEDRELKIRNFQTSKVNEYNFKDHLSLTEIGPSLNLKIRKIQLALEDTYKKALIQPKELKPKKVKNVERDILGNKKGRLHMGRQDLKQMALKKYKKILKKREKKPTDKKEEKKAGEDI
jgi:ribosome production factor 2